MKTNQIHTNRRHFLTKAVPACALACAFRKEVFGMSQDIPTQEKQDPVHKFDQEMKFRIPITNRQFRSVQYGIFIRFCKGLVEEIGEKEALVIIKDIVGKESYALGQGASQRTGENSLASYANLFKGPVLSDSLTMEILEDTDSVFEIKVSECLAYEICKAEACDGELGFACICHGDYAMAEGYNPKIELIRDKTLMQGYDCCNHRYVHKA